MIDPEIINKIESIKNRCEVLLMISDCANAEPLSHTILEDIYADAQELAENHCVEQKIEHPSI